MLSQALALHQAGRLDEAAEAYGRILAAQEGDYVALHNLGLARFQQGRAAEAEALFRRALGVNPRAADAHGNLGLVLKRLGRFAEAEQSFRAALDANPQYPEALNNLGHLLLELGRLDEAEPVLRRAVELRPGFAQPLCGLGKVLRRLGRAEEAASLLRRVGTQDALFELGMLYYDRQQWPEALETYQSLLAQNPNLPEAENNLANILLALGRPEDAAQVWENAAARTGNPLIWTNLAVARHRQGRTDLAVPACRRAAEACGDDEAAMGRVLEILSNIGQWDLVLELRQRLVARNPDLAGHHFQLGLARNRVGDQDGAMDSFARALALQPDYLEAADELAHLYRKQCRWTPLPALERLLQTALDRPDGLISPFTLLAWSNSTPQSQLEMARRVGRLWAPAEPLPAVAPRRDGGPIRLGYLSSDYGRHATAHLISGLFEHHDRSRFQVIGLCTGFEDGSGERRRIVNACDHFVQLGHMSDRDAARHIRELGVDILVDLKGYTAASRLAIALYRPAPVQVHYLGYPGTVASDAIDYLIADGFIVPPELRPFMGEKVVTLPHCYQINDDCRPVAPPSAGRAEMGLPEDGFVFCSFNAPYKITPAIFDVWMGLLARVPGSVLWQWSPPGPARDNLQREAVARGVDPNRIVFADSTALAPHLARYRLADLFLDTFPVNGHTTASDALWVGLPVLTCAGDTIVSRVAGSLLHTLGLPELVTGNLEDYAAQALDLARNPDKLAELRQRLHKARHTSPLFDTGASTRALEAAYQEMWRRHQAGEAPQDFRV